MTSTGTLLGWSHTDPLRGALVGILLEDGDTEAALQVRWAETCGGA